MTNVSFDPLIGTEIMELLAVDPHHLSIARTYHKLQDVVGYFQGKNHRKEILRILQGKTGDKLDIMWTYVQLQKEKTKTLQQLDPTDFEPDIVKEITQGHITKPKRDLLKAEIQKRKQEAKQAAELKTKTDKAVGKVFNELKLDKYETAIDGLENIEQQLSFY